MSAKAKLIIAIFLYLISGFVFYILTHDNKFHFLLYKLVHGVLIWVVLYYAYKYFSKKYE